MKRWWKQRALQHRRRDWLAIGQSSAKHTSHTMNNPLETAMDNIFISSANILDTLTYRLSSTATSVAVPNNNDTLIAPLVEQLTRDYKVFNQVLDDYGLDLQNCKHIVHSMKMKAEKERIVKEQREKEKLAWRARETKKAKGTRRIWKARET